MNDLAGEQDETWACAVCGEILQRFGDGSQTVGFLHIGEDEPNVPESMRVDHIAVPTRLSDVQARTRCDFCLADKPGWVVPVAPFTPDGQDLADGRPPKRSGMDWLACEVCARLMKKDRWPALAERATRAVAAKHGVSPNAPELVHQMAAVVEQVRLFQYAPPRRAETT